MTPVFPVYREHCESIEQENFLRIPLGRSWLRLTMTPLVFAVSVLLLAGCASNRRQQQHSSHTPFFDTPDVDSLH
jgi:predicted solute-binding protein